MHFIARIVKLAFCVTTETSEYENFIPSVQSFRISNSRFTDRKRCL